MSLIALTQAAVVNTLMIKPVRSRIALAPSDVAWLLARAEPIPARPRGTSLPLEIVESSTTALSA